MKKIVHFCIDHPYWVLGILAVITLFFALQIPKIKMDSRVEVMLRHNHPAVKVFIENKKSFDQYSNIVVGMLHTDIYNPSSLEKLHKVDPGDEKIKGIKKVTCLLNAKNIQGSESGLECVTPCQGRLCSLDT